MKNVCESGNRKAAITKLSRLEAPVEDEIKYNQRQDTTDVHTINDIQTTLFIPTLDTTTKFIIA